jgi:hypothetical protein
LQSQNLICQSVDFWVQNGLKLTYEHLENQKKILDLLPHAMRRGEGRERAGGKGRLRDQTGREGKGSREREGMLGEGGEGNGWQGGEGVREHRGGKGIEKEGISPPNIQTKLRP